MDGRQVDESNGSLDIHSFVVRVWFDEPGAEARPRSWHGQITHVTTGEQRSVKDLDEITAFIRSSLNL